MEDIGLFFEYNNLIIQLPVNPEKLKVKYNGNNSTEEIVKLGQVNVLKNRKLAEISFDSFFPEQSWFPAVRTTGQFENHEYYRKFFLMLLDDKKPARFITTGLNINMLVSVESFEYDHQAGDHEDEYYSLSLKEYKPFKAYEIQLPSSNSTSTSTTVQTTQTPQRTATQITIGSNVILNGTVHYDSYGAKPGKTFTNYQGKINLINMKGSYPYHVTTPSGGYLGWVKGENLTLV